MKHLLLLHGAIGSKIQLDVLKTALSNSFQVHSINFSGHGGEAANEEFSIQLFAEEVLAWMKKTKVEKVSIFGYSMGGYVALYLARFHPQSIDRIITLGTKLHWDEVVAAREAAMLNPDVIEQKLPKFAGQLAQLHGALNWKKLLHQTAAMLKRMGASNPFNSGDYGFINTKVLLVLGDRDKMVSLDETLNAYRKLKEAQLAILPGTPHMIETVDTELLAAIIKKFLQGL